MRRLLPAALGLTFFCLYALTLTRAHSGDDLQWIMQVESGVSGTPIPHPASTDSTDSLASGGAATQLQPRYLFMLPVSAALVETAHRFGWEGPAVGPIRLAHAALGALGIVCFFLALRRVGGSGGALCASIGLGASHAWSYYSTHADYPIVAQSLSCLVLYLLCSLLARDARHQTRGRAGLLGAVTALSILFMLTRVVLVPVTAVALLMSRVPRRALAKAYAAALAGLLLVAVLGSVATAWQVTPSLSKLWAKAVYSGYASHDVALLDLPRAVYGLSKSLVVFPAFWPDDPHERLSQADGLVRAAFFGWYALVALLAAAPFLLLVAWRHRLQAQRALVLALATWFALEFAFAVYWEPTYIKWFVALLIPWWGLIGLIPTTVFADRPAAQRIFVRGAAVFASVLLVVNLTFSLVPDSGPGAMHWQRLAEGLEQRSTPADLFIATESSPLEFYLPYFGHRRTVSIPLVDFIGGHDEARTLEGVRSVMRAAAEARGQVYVYPCAEPLSAWLSKLGISAGALEPVELGELPSAGLRVCRVAD